mgnify:FL=1
MISNYNFNSHHVGPKNVQDEFFNMTTSQIRNAVETGRSSMVSVCMNLTHDFNKASVVRASNAFLGNSVFMVGKRRFDRRGTVGMHHYENVLHADELDDVFNLLIPKGYTFFAVDNSEGFTPQPVYDVDIPEKSAFIYGEEQNGLSKEVIEQCDAMIYIPQYGVVRSLNVAQSAAVIMSEYARRHRIC